MLGRERTRQEMLTICKSIKNEECYWAEMVSLRESVPFVPVSDAIILGFARMSKMIGDSNQGIYKAISAGESRKHVNIPYVKVCSFSVNVWFNTMKSVQNLSFAGRQNASLSEPCVFDSTVTTINY